MKEIEFLTINQLAEILQVTPRTIMRYIKIGRIQALKLGDLRKSPVRIHVSELIRLQKVGYEENMKEIRKSILGEENE